MLCPEDRRPLPGGAVHFLSPPRPLPPPVPPRGGGRTNFRDLDPVWERERERVNRDALTRLKTPGGVGGSVLISVTTYMLPTGGLLLKNRCEQEKHS